MPSFHFRITCGEPRSTHGDSHHSTAKIFEEDANIASAQEELLRDELRHTGCLMGKGYVQSAEDLPLQQIRQGTTLVSSTDLSFPVGGEVCGNCGWITSNGTVVIDEANTWVHYCATPECGDAQHRQSEKLMRLRSDKHA
jgi:hypothetical protein